MKSSLVILCSMFFMVGCNKAKHRLADERNVEYQKKLAEKGQKAKPAAQPVVVNVPMENPSTTMTPSPSQPLQNQQSAQNTVVSEEPGIPARLAPSASPAPAAAPVVNSSPAPQAQKPATTPAPAPAAKPAATPATAPATAPTAAHAQPRKPVNGFSGKIQVTKDDEKLVKNENCSVNVRFQDQNSFVDLDMGRQKIAFEVKPTWLGEGDVFMNKETIAAEKNVIQAVRLDPASLFSYVNISYDVSSDTAVFKRESYVIQDEKMMKNTNPQEIVKYLQENMQKIGSDTNFKGIVLTLDALRVTLNKEGQVSAVSYDYQEAINGTGNSETGEIKFKNYFSATCSKDGKASVKPAAAPAAPAAAASAPAAKPESAPSSKPATTDATPEKKFTEAQHLNYDEYMSMFSNIAQNASSEEMFKLLISTYVEIPGLDRKKMAFEAAGDHNKLSVRITQDGKVVTEVANAKVDEAGKLSEAEANNGFRFAAVCGGEKCSVLYTIFRKLDNGKLVANIPLIYKKIEGSYKEATLHPKAFYDAEEKKRQAAAPKK